MMEHASRALAKVDQRLVVGAMLLLIALLLLEGWLLVLMKPLAEYQRIVATKASLSASLSQSADSAGELSGLSAELARLSDNLTGQLHLPVSDEKLVASLLEALDKSAAIHHVRLSGVKPLESRPVAEFDEVSFEVSAKGPYLTLCEWMLDFGKILGNNASINEFDMKSSDEGRQVLLTLRVALYRLQQQAQARK